MGKTLIIKGADFSINSIPDDSFTTLALAQGTIAGTAASGPSYPGDWEFSSTNYNNKRVKSAIDAGILVESGASVSIKGLFGLGYGYFVYTTDSPTHANVLDIETYCQQYPTLNVEENKNSAIWTNNTGQDVYIYFIFKWNGSDGIHQDSGTIRPADVTIQTKVL